jgi:GNAT superfamily N-acetyltransferase
MEVRIVIENERQRAGAPLIRACVDGDRPSMLGIVNAAAEAYRGAIPPDCWREPYMPADELASEIADGVDFAGYEVKGVLAGVMGMQTVRDVCLIRHAYVLPDLQGHGIGSELLEHLCRRIDRPILVGTWRAASWAIRFYERHGFAAVPDKDVASLLKSYWAVPARQIETSVVLSSPSWRPAQGGRLGGRDHFAG